MANPVLKIFGVIEPEDPMEKLFFGEEITERTSLKTVTDFLDANKEAEAITLEINSPGGCVDTGFQIYDALVVSKKKIECNIVGNCYSIATVIALSAPKDSRKIYEHGQFLIHNPYIPEYTLADAYEADDLQKLADEMRAVEDKLLDFYVQKIGKSADEIKELMKADRIIHSQEALELGFVGEVIKTVDATARLAKGITFFNSKIKPKSNKMATTIEGILSAIDNLGKKIEAKFKPEVKNYVFTDTDGNTLFETEKETEEIMVGDAATPDGTFTLTDGRTVVVTGGKIESITEPASDNEEMENLKKENAELKNQIETLTASVNEITKDFTELKTQAKALVSKGNPIGKQQPIPSVDAKERTVEQEKKAAEKRLAELREKKNGNKK